MAQPLTVTTTPANDLTGITANTQVTIIPYWTLATAFPPTDVNVSFTPTSTAPTYKTQVEIPDDSAPSISYSLVYYFDGNTSKWRVENVGDPDRGDDVLSPDSFFVVRNDNGAPTLPLTALGSVLMKKFSAPLMTSASGTYDNAVAMLRPIDVPLNATGFKLSDGSFIANDQLLVFDNTVAALNKTPSATYFYNTAVGNSGGWRLTGGGTTDHGSDIIPAGNAMIVRKAQTGGGATAFWTNAFPVKALTAASRKEHGSGGPQFDVPLSLSLRWNTVPGVECRIAGSTPAGAGVDHQIVLTFPSNISFTSIIPTSGVATVGSSSGNNTTTVTVNLTSVTDAQKVAVTLVGVSDGTNTNDVGVEMGALLGDTTGNGFVNSGDVSQVQSQSGLSLTGANFREDLTANGFINSGDVSLVQSKSGSALP